MVKAIIFDLDNTLIDFVKMKRESNEAAVKAMIASGLHVSQKRGMETLINLYEEVGWENQKIFQMFIKKISGKVDYKILAAGIIAYRRVKDGMMFPYPGVRETLIKLKMKYKLGVVSDAPSLPAWMRLETMGLQDMFDVVITLNDSKVKKPNSRGFKIALKKLGVRPEDAVMVGDNFKRDVVGANSLGMTTVLALYGKGADGSADYKIRKFKDLLKIF